MCARPSVQWNNAQNARDIARLGAYLIEGRVHRMKSLYSPSLRSPWTRRLALAVALIVMLTVAAASLGCVGQDSAAGPEIDAPRSVPGLYTQAFVQAAIDRYEDDGLEATLDHYNDPASVDGQWYIFMVSEDGDIIAHANQENVGVHASHLTGSNDYPSGKIVLDSATEDGVWSGYTFWNPTTNRTQAKHSWLITHDGIIFGSGWYEDGPRRSDQPAYTQAFVEQALNLYDASGLDLTVQYYNSPASVDGQWYVFIVDASGILVAHPNADLVGVPITDVTGANGYPTGQIVWDDADEDGQWSGYVFSNPATGRSQAKNSWLVKHDGIIFGSGWYEDGPPKSDQPAYTQSIVEQALNLYDASGIDVVVEYYNDSVNVDGEWYVFVIDAETERTIGHYRPEIRERQPSERIDSTGYFYGDDVLAAQEDGRWVQYYFRDPSTGEDTLKNSWVVRRDNYIFGSGWY